MSDRATRVRVGGPLGPYSDGFRTELAARGYAPSSAAGQLQVMAHLSRWLVDRGLDEHALTSACCGGVPAGPTRRGLPAVAVGAGHGAAAGSSA